MLFFGFFCVPSFEERGGVSQPKCILPSREGATGCFEVFSRRYLHIKTSMWEFVGTSGVQCAQGCLLSPAPTHYHSEPSEGCARKTARSPAAEPSQLAFLAFCCRRRCRFGHLIERRRPFHPSVHPSLLTSRSCLFVFSSLRPSERSGVLQDVLCEVTGSQWEPACAAASSVRASLHA